MNDQPFIDPEYQVHNIQQINDIPPNVPTPLTASLSTNDLSSAITTLNPKKKLILILALAGAAILLVGGGVWAYFTYFPTPEKVIKKSLRSLSSITSVEYESVTFLEGDPTNFMSDFAPSTSQPKSSSNKASATLTLKGAYDIQQLTNSSSWFTISLLSKGLLGSDFNFGIESRFINKVIYTNFTDLPNLGFIDLSKLKNQWMKIDLEEIAKKFGKGDEVKKAEEATKITPEQKQKIKAALESANIISITEKMPIEDINGEPSYHYKFIINQEGLKRFITALDQIFNETKNSGGEQTIASITTATKQLLDTAKEMPQGELWIGKNDYLPRKIMFAGALLDASEKAIDANYKFTLTLKNFNQPIIVEAPASSRKAEEVLQELLGPLMAGLSNKNQESLFDSEPDSDNDKLSDALELKLGTDPNKADTDGDGFNDGTEVENNYNPKGEGKLSDTDQDIIAEALGFNKTSLEQARQKARDDKRLSDIKHIQNSLESYYNDHMEYPNHENLILGSTNANVLSGDGFSNRITTGAVYMEDVPSNPTPNGANYIYNRIDGDHYTLTFNLEADTNKLKSGPHIATQSGIQ